ncbi:unnamed protein product [Ilex paraguariensis]|uniref:PGG domain-containing protein n=1 Tax=Ilex paraguariensis TaxID=185542 RepID=A0ABC8UW85_9AQUA
MFSHGFNKREVEDFAIIKDSLKKIKKEEVLNWKDHEGNTVLHIATLNRQREMINLLLDSNPGNRNEVEVNVVNKNNQTALDILLQLQRIKGDDEIENILRGACAMSASQIISLAPPPATTTTTEKTYELKGRPATNDFSTVIVIAAIVIAATCFLTGINPPGGVWQYNYRPLSNTTAIEHKAGTAIMATSFTSVLFMHFNLYCFFASLLTITVLTKGSPLRVLLLVPLALLSFAYLMALALVTPEEKFSATIGTFLSASAVWIFQLVLEAWAYRRKRKESKANDDLNRTKRTQFQILSHDGTKI